MGVTRALVDALPDIRQHLLRQAQQAIDPLIGQAVVGVAAALLACDQAAVAQAAQVVGDVGLAEPGRRRNLAHVQRPGAQRLQYGEPGGIGKAAEQFGFQLKLKLSGDCQHPAILGIMISAFNDVMIHDFNEPVEQTIAPMCRCHLTSTAAAA